MFHLLIVDDEPFAIEGILRGVDWGSLPFAQIHTANHTEQAKQIIGREPVDVMICDIEMPGASGLELMKWVKQHNPDIEAIFLTCHADFRYAQQAVQLGSFDYLLKPVDYQELLDTARRALLKRTDALALRRTNERYKQKRNVLFERFWQDLFAERISPSREPISQALEASDMPLSVESRVLPILISVESWHKPLAARDERVMEFALRNAAEELLLGGDAGQVLQEANGLHFVILYEGGQQENMPGLPQLKQRGQAYIEACAAYLYCSLSCYIGEWTTLADASDSYRRLLLMERSNVTQQQAVLLLQDQQTDQKPPAVPALFKWSVWLETADKEQLNRLAEDSFARMARDAAITQETLAAFYHALLQTVFYVLHKKDVPVQDVFPGNDLLNPDQAAKSLRHLQEWVMSVIDRVTGYLSRLGEQDSIVDKVKRHMREHLYEDLSREELARVVAINPAYLSRLFRKETGMSPMDYLQQEKMRKAEELLLHTQETVSGIAQRFNYSNFSHFSKLFRKQYGLNPQEYRKAHKAEPSFGKEL